MPTYHGGCHCGKVRYEADLTIDKLISCNCSICRKKGHLLAFAPETAFRILQGKGELTDYQFGQKRIHHLFCKHCGISSFGRGTRPDGTQTVAINARCLDDFDPETVPVTKFDGKSL